jgi:hypothetical protein
MKKEALVDRRMGASQPYSGDGGVLKRVVIPSMPAGENQLEHVCVACCCHFLQSAKFVLHVARVWSRW